ncbi:MAG: heavy-metal-associated domain-containing protein [Methylophilaceae bacterium]
MAHQQQFVVTGMHCASCVGKVKAALAAFATEVEVTLKPPRAVLTGGKASLAQLNQALVAVGAYTLVEHEAAPSWFATYKPLLLILAYLLLVTLGIQIASEQASLESWMRHFMAGFFLVFSFFKLLDLRGFAESYATYDLLAMRWRGYGLIYPFIELGLGLAYLADWQHYSVNVATLVVMTFSSLGVFRAVLNKQKIRCACLGAVFNLPMSTVTIVEDLLMAAMAGWMLF